MRYELLFHGIEVFILLFGVAVPVVWSAIRLRSILMDFPPHKHVNGKLIYPKGYEPAEMQELEL